jgi:hypothetical protein
MSNATYNKVYIHEIQTSAVAPFDPSKMERMAAKPSAAARTPWTTTLRVIRKATLGQKKKIIFLSCRPCHLLFSHYKH